MTEPTDADDAMIERIEAAYKEATPGVWMHEFESDWGPEGVHTMVGYPPDKYAVPIARFTDQWGTTQNAVENADFITSLYNNAPQLLALARDGVRYRRTMLSAGNGLKEQMFMAENRSLDRRDGEADDGEE